jgi:hypothetical protein
VDLTPGLRLDAGWRQAPTRTASSRPAKRSPTTWPTSSRRIRAAWPAYAERFTLLHEGLLALGYEPKVPVPRSGSKPPGYVSYADPADGNRNLGNANSSSFTFMRMELRDELMKHDFVGGSRYRRCTSTAKRR